MTMTSYQLADLGGRLKSRSLLHFCRMLPVSSRTRRAESAKAAEEGMWEDLGMMPGLTATVIDELRYVEYLLKQARSTHRLPLPVPIERPGVETGVKRVGDGAIPIKDFDDWWNGGKNG